MRYGNKTRSGSDVADWVRGFRPVCATGGTISTFNLNGVVYQLHTFNSSDDFVVSDSGSLGEVEVAMIGGGGGATGGFVNQTFGGGGAGQYTRFAVLISALTYPVVVGAGGTSGFGNNSGRGNRSSAFGFVCAGGGGTMYDPPIAANSVGACGAGAASTAGGTNVNGSLGLAHFAGGGGSNVAFNTRAAGGGGGVTAVGANAAQNVGGDGGAGIEITFTGSSFYWGGGGAGGCANSAGVRGFGGSGVGGDGGLDGSGSNGTANTGSGGGGGGANTTNFGGGNGGSGCVLIRYPLQRIGAGV